ncbi:MAG: SUMF1/EgtB/PvdO family nonheme iron enzyme [Chloroflexota bacterium]
MSRENQHKSDDEFRRAERLEFLRSLRREAGISQKDAATKFDLEGRQARQTIGAWERGQQIPDVRHRTRFIGYLWDNLRLRNSPAKFEETWQILVEEWQWSPISETEIKEYHLGRTSAQDTIVREENQQAPFKGLLHFGMSDADIFFGREELTVELVKLIKEQSFLAVIGASGSGKSSVVRAGLASAIERGALPIDGIQMPMNSTNWPIHIITPTNRPLNELAASLTRNEKSVATTASLLNDLSNDPRSLHLYICRLMEGRPSDESLLLIIDQFEELFTLCRNPSMRQSFVDNLLYAAGFPLSSESNELEISSSSAIVILTLRADFYTHCAEFTLLRRALEKYQKYIGPMNRHELRQVIEKPVLQSGGNLEPGLVDLMLDDASQEPGALPLLSHALLETWKRRNSRTLTFAGYQASGRVQGAITKTAESTYSVLTQAQQTIAKNIFLRLTQLGEGVQDTRRRVPLTELLSNSQAASDTEEVLQTLQNARLLTAVHESKSEEDIEKETAQEEIYIDVAHEALIREWGTLREWLTDDREGLRIHRHLTESAQAWLVLAKDPGELYRGIRLSRALAWEIEHSNELNEFERDFLDNSRRERDKLIEQENLRQTEREESRQRELKAAEEMVTNQDMYLRRLSIFAVITVILAGLALFFFIQARNRAVLAQQQLDRLQAGSILQVAREAKVNLKPEQAIEKFREAEQEADQASPPIDLHVDMQREISDTLRYVAEQWTWQGEELLREALASDSEPQWQQAYISATSLFSNALALKPPSNTYVYVKMPAFIVGSTRDGFVFTDDNPPKPIQIDEFWIMRTEVTNKQYKRCVDAGICKPPFNNHWNKEQFMLQPVVRINWYQANAYAKWVGGRLPSDAEWEYACRGKEGWTYPWENGEPNASLLNYRNSDLNILVEVGGYSPGVHGLYDMAGNVWEWTSSKRPNYPFDRRADQYSLASGSFADRDPRIRCSFRTKLTPDRISHFAGFRVIVSSSSF